jgi:hypothetical protein
MNKARKIRPIFNANVNFTNFQMDGKCDESSKSRLELPELFATFL